MVGAENCSSLAEREFYLGWLAAVELLLQVRGKVTGQDKENIEAAIEEFEIQTGQEFVKFEGKPRLVCKLTD